jgi:hypothetical protein
MLDRIEAGERDAFAIVCEVSEWLERDSQLGIGSFRYFVAGASFGRSEPDATLLGCSVQNVERRIRSRGRRVYLVEDGMNAAEIVSGYLRLYSAAWIGDRGASLYRTASVEAYGRDGVVAAPDGDEAFDDGSHVLQFDRGDDVRVIAVRNFDTEAEALGSVREALLTADQFYGVLSKWVAEFHLIRQARRSCWK